MVVRHLAIVEYLLRLEQGLAVQGRREGFIATQSLQDAGTLGINVIAQESGIHAGISRHLLLVKGLDKFQRLVGRIRKLLVALHLEGSQVEQARRCLAPFLAGDGGHGEGQILDAGQQFLATRPVGDGIDAAVLLFFLGFLGGRIVLLLLGLQYQLLLTLPNKG